MSTGRNQLDKDMNKAEIKGNICKVRDERVGKSKYLGSAVAEDAGG